MKSKTGKLLLIGINFAVFLFFLMLKQSAFEGNDDEMMNLIAAGAFGTNGNHLIFSGILTEWVLRILYLLPWKINYYLLWFQMLAFAALSAVSTVCWSEKPVIKGVVFTLLLNLIFANDFYLYMQFTKLGSLLAAAAILLLHDAFRRRSWLTGSTGILLLVLGISVRQESALFALPFGACWLLEDYCSVCENGKLLRFRDQAGGKFLVKLVLSTAAACAILLGLNRLPYQSPEWKAYERFNRVRSNLLDYGMADYETNADAYINIGVSYEDYRLLREWVFADPEVFTVEKLEKIDAISNGRGMRAGLKQAYASFVSAVRYGSYSHLVLILLAVLVIADGKKKHRILLATGGMVLAEYLFLGILGRINIRVELGIWFAALLVLLYETEEERLLEKKPLLVIAAVLAAAEGFRSVQAIAERLELNRKAAESTEFSEYFLKDAEKAAENCYLMDEKTIYRGGSIFSSPYTITSDLDQLLINVCPLGGWEYPAPFLIEDIKEAGVANPLKDLLYQDHIYFATVNRNGICDVLLNYLREHYDPSAEMRHAGEIRGIGIVEYYIPE